MSKSEVKARMVCGAAREEVSQSRGRDSFSQLELSNPEELPTQRRLNRTR